MSQNELNPVEGTSIVPTQSAPQTGPQQETYEPTLEDVDFEGTGSVSPQPGDVDPPAEPEPEAESTGSEQRPTSICNAEELDRCFGNDLLWNSSRCSWMKWTGTHWALDTEAFAECCAKDVALKTKERLLSANVDRDTAEAFGRKTESVTGINNMLKLLAIKEGRRVQQNQLDANPMLLNLANNTLNLRDGSQYSPRPSDKISVCLPFEYDQNAQCPTWERFLQQVMERDVGMITYLQRLAGVCLTGLAELQELYILFGPGANGKSIFTDTLVGMLGTYACVAPESLLTSVRSSGDHPTTVARLAGKRLVVCSETSTGSNLNVSLTKRLTGDDVITARFMRQDYFEFPRTWKVILATNNRPKITENSNAVWRRIRLVPFNFVVPTNERDLQLLHKLRNEYPGILAWAIRGWKSYRDEGGMQPPPKVTAATEEYRNMSDPVKDFVENFCEFGGDYYVSRTVLYRHFEQYVGSPEEPEHRKVKEFYDRVEQFLGVTQRRKKRNGKAVREFLGIRLKRNVRM